MKIHKNREKINSILDGRGENAVLLEGFDSCIIGVTDMEDGGVSVCYDTEKILQILRKQGMYNSEAQEYFDFNIAGCKFSGGQPTFIDVL